MPHAREMFGTYPGGVVRESQPSWDAKRRALTAPSRVAPALTPDLASTGLSG